MVVRVLAGAWWLFEVLAGAWYVATGRILAALWWLLKLCARGGYVLCRAILWQVPKYAFAAAGRSYRRLPPRRRRLVMIGGAVVLVTLSAASYAWYAVLSETLGTSGPRQLTASPGAEEEVCEFLARPAASLYIDGELVSKEIPPLYRTVLSVGDHTVRFVGPGGSTHEMKIRVVKGRPAQWFMNFVDGSVRRRAPVSVTE